MITRSAESGPIITFILFQIPGKHGIISRFDDKQYTHGSKSKMEPPMGIEPTTYALPRHRYTP